MLKLANFKTSLKSPLNLPNILIRDFNAKNVRIVMTALPVNSPLNLPTTLTTVHF